MEVARSRKGILVSQQKYVLDLLKETRMLGCKPAETSMDSSTKIGANKDSVPVDKGNYQRLVGKLTYLSYTRPDIGFSISGVSHLINDPNEAHMEAVNRILMYVKMIPSKGFYFRKNTRKYIKVFADADWAESITDRRLTYVWGNLVTWRSKKQLVVFWSSVEAEFRAMALGICEGIWLGRLMRELGIITFESMKVFCDNQSAINVAKYPMHHDRTKHLEIDLHFIKEKIENNKYFH